MARPEDEDAPWTRQLLVGAGVLVAVALVIGGVVSVIALGAAKVTGIDSAKGRATAPPSLYMPSGDPTTEPQPFPDPAAPSGSASPTPSASPSASASPTKKPQAISLQAFPKRVSANQRINLTGVYNGGEGARLQVQRFEDGWTDFPVDASVSGGVFQTWITTGHSGRQKFRVVDKSSGKKSNMVRVTVGG